MKDIAVGKVDQTYDAVHHGIAESDESVDESQLDTIDHGLDKVDRAIGPHQEDNAPHDAHGKRPVDDPYDSAKHVLKEGTLHAASVVALRSKAGLARATSTARSAGRTVIHQTVQRGGHGIVALPNTRAITA
jgi:hypothetical protein